MVELLGGGHIYSLFLHLQCLIIINMKFHFKTILLASAIALLALIISQGIWIHNSMVQRASDKDTSFQHCFNHSITNLINELMGKSDGDSPFNIEPLDSVTDSIELQESPNVIYMGNPTDSDNASRLIEDALILLHIEQGNFHLNRLDSMVTECCSERIDKISSVKLDLLDSNNNNLDSIRYIYPNAMYQLHETFYAERTVKSLNKSYIIRAEYKIAESKNLQKMGMATLVSLLASIVIISVLLYLNYILKLRHSQMQFMERTFHGAIHDLKSPLGYVYFSITTLEEEESNIGKREALSLTADKVSFLTDKINRILQSGINIKRIDKEHKTEFFLFDIIEQIETEIKAMYPEKDIHFQNNFDADLSLLGAQDLLEAVFRVWLDNAVKYNDNKPTVIINSYINVDKIIIEIEDDGIGIHKNKLKKLFKPYYTTDNKNGTGIGLYYAKTIIKAHGGEISVSSDIGKGTRFLILIPNQKK